jgi:hypothetical protein
MLSGGVTLGRPSGRSGVAGLRQATVGGWPRRPLLTKDLRFRGGWRDLLGGADGFVERRRQRSARPLSCAGGPGVARSPAGCLPPVQADDAAHHWLEEADRLTAVSGVEGGLVVFLAEPHAGRVVGVPGVSVPRVAVLAEVVGVVVALADNSMPGGQPLSQQVSDRQALPLARSRGSRRIGAFRCRTPRPETDAPTSLICATLHSSFRQPPQSVTHRAARL